MLRRESKHRNYGVGSQEYLRCRRWQAKQKAQTFGGGCRGERATAFDQALARLIKAEAQTAGTAAGEGFEQLFRLQ